MRPIFDARIAVYFRRSRRVVFAGATPPDSHEAAVRSSVVLVDVSEMPWPVRGPECGVALRLRR